MTGSAQNGPMDDAELWWQTLAGGPLLLAHYDSQDRLLQANAAYRAAWGLDDADQPTWTTVAETALASGRGPDWEIGALQRAAAQRGRLPTHAYEQAWRDGRRLWWVEQRTEAGGLTCTGLDLSAALRSRSASTGRMLDEPEGRQALQALLVDTRAWPLCIAELASQGGPGEQGESSELLARTRGDDVCMRLSDGRVFVVLPSTGPAQAQALVQRLGALHVTEACWGESAPELLARA